MINVYSQSQQIMVGLNMDETIGYDTTGKLGNLETKGTGGVEVINQTIPGKKQVIFGKYKMQMIL